MKALLIAEKPSLMREIQAAYRSARNVFAFDIDFLSQAGHLVGLKLPSEINEEVYGKWKLENFPIDVPYIYKVNSGKFELLQKIKNAVKSGEYDFIIHAGDPDGEGELLVNLVLQYVGNKLPVKRFWSNDITHPAIIAALQDLKDDSNYQAIFDAALTRQHLDYQFGMNITGVTTLKMGELYKLGRVKAAIIRMVVDRERAIRDFVQTSTWKRMFTYGTCEFICDEEFETEEKALLGMPKFDYATVTNVKDEVKSQKAPKLFKLASLQVEANKQFGFSGARTLEVLQSLYEAKCVSYPRTDCEYISSNVDLRDILSVVAPEEDVDVSMVTAHVDQVKADKTYVNDKAIASEGHTAIIPTGTGYAGNSTDEKKLYDLIVRRFLAIFAPAKKVRSLTVTAIPGNVNTLGEYIYKEVSDVEAGFETVLNPGYKLREGKGISFNSNTIIRPVTFQTKECVAKPPVRYNDGSILKAMDHPEEYIGDDNKKIAYSIGTPATRSTIVEECKKCGYINVEKKAYYATEKAERVINALGDISLFSVSNSGRWEQMLEEIRHGEVQASQIENALLKECQDITNDIKNRDIIKMRTQAYQTESLGKCPSCGKDVLVGKYGAYCSGKCGMIFGKAYGKKLSDTQIKSLLAGKKILMRGLQSKSGKTYNAYLTPVGVESFNYDGKVGKSFKYNMEFTK